MVGVTYSDCLRVVIIFPTIFYFRAGQRFLSRQVISLDIVVRARSIGSSTFVVGSLRCSPILLRLLKLSDVSSRSLTAVTGGLSLYSKATTPLYRSVLASKRIVCPSLCLRVGSDSDSTWNCSWDKPEKMRPLLVSVLPWMTKVFLKMPCLTFTDCLAALESHVPRNPSRHGKTITPHCTCSVLFPLLCPGSWLKEGKRHMTSKGPTVIAIFMPDVLMSSHPQVYPGSVAWDQALLIQHNKSSRKKTFGRYSLHAKLPIPQMSVATFFWEKIFQVNQSLIWKKKLPTMVPSKKKVPKKVFPNVGVFSRKKQKTSIHFDCRIAP